MSNNIFPPEILNFTIDHQVARHSSRSQFIYIVIISLLLGALISLPLISVDVSVQSAGLIRPSQEITEIYSANNGKIDKLNFQNNQQVVLGDTLLKLNNELINARMVKINTRKEEINGYLDDLRRDRWVTFNNKLE